jgi:hypothetical protein
VNAIQKLLSSFKKSLANSFKGFGSEFFELQAKLGADTFNFATQHGQKET